MASVDSLIDILRRYYESCGRHDLPWRQPEADGAFDPYKILVSEVMLQQTQVPRVIPKYGAFLQQFPTFAALAAASLGKVLVAWQGLGYNRRAKFLWQAAQIVVREHGGILPNDQAALTHLPGIGPNTAGAIWAYAFNEPAVFIETNIRTVYIHHFFADRTGVADRDIVPLLASSLTRWLEKEQIWLARSGEPDSLRQRRQEKPAGLSREFYWALMDYGAYLKSTSGNAGRVSKGYIKQSKFEGSRRQLRGAVLRLLAAGERGEQELLKRLPDERMHEVLTALVSEGLIRRTNGGYRLA